MAHSIVAISDQHGTLPELPECDLLLIGGDICPITNHGVDFQQSWLLSEYRRWLESVPARKIIMVAGNHDFVFEQRSGFLPADYPATYLQDSECQWEGLRIWGTPWQPWFCDWAFNLYEPELKKKWALIPKGIDILVLHGPPRGYGDRVLGSGEETGSPALLQRIKTVAPRLAIFGHIHEGRGQWQLGPTTLANVSLLNERYKPVHAPWTFTWPKDAKG